MLKNRSISRDLTLSLVAVLFLVASVTIFLNSYFLIQKGKTQLETKTEEYFSSLSNVLIIPIWNYDSLSIESICNTYMQNEHISGLRVLDAEKNVLYMKQKDNVSKTLQRSGDIFFQDNSVPIGHLQLEATTQGLEEQGRQLVIFSILTVLLVLVAVFFLTGYFLRIFLRQPLNNLINDMEIISAGNYDHPFTTHPQQETQEISVKFKEMAKKVQLREQSIEEYSHDLESMVGERTAELQKTLDDLKQTQSQLLQSEKMASIGQLAAGVAHEINNPMGFISSNINTMKTYVSRFQKIIERQESWLEVHKDQEALGDTLALKKKLKLDFVLSDINALIDESQDGADRVRKIVEDLKGFSRANEKKQELADLNECLDVTLNIARNELKYKAEIVKEYGDLPQTNCFAQQLNQAFMTILVNAAQAIPAQGLVTIRTKHENGFIYISISDTGKGIPEGNLSRLFEPFFTTKDIGQGTGLGLSITYDIINKHDGDIEVTSEVGKGTTVTISLPVKK